MTIESATSPTHHRIGHLVLFATIGFVCVYQQIQIQRLVNNMDERLLVIQERDQQIETQALVDERITSIEQQVNDFILKQSQIESKNDEFVVSIKEKVVEMDTVMSDLKERRLQASPFSCSSGWCTAESSSYFLFPKGIVIGNRNNDCSYGEGILSVSDNSMPDSGNCPSGDFAVTFGACNKASGRYSTVTGGGGSTASGDSSSISGGTNNESSDIHASVSGGHDNKAQGGGSSVNGGVANKASGYYSSISGGYNNTASKWYATVSGEKSSQTLHPPIYLHLDVFLGTTLLLFSFIPLLLSRYKSYITKDQSIPKRIKV